MCCLRLDEADQALRWLELAKKDRPPPGVMKLLRELRALAYFHHSTMARETADKELEDAHRRDPKNPRLNRALVEKCEAEGDGARVLELLKHILDVAEGKDRPKEVMRLLECYHDQARKSVEAGDLGRARSLLREASALAERSEPIQLLLGDVELRRRSDDAALKAWAQVPGPAARRRVSGMLSRIDDPRDLLKRYPQPEVLIDLAVRLIERGAHDQALRTLEKARDLGADEVEIEKVLGDLAVAGSEPHRARQHYLRAMTGMFGGKLLAPGE
jgi:tetratricopeptide (TPR) repeat protein